MFMRNKITTIISVIIASSMMLCLSGCSTKTNTQTVAQNKIILEGTDLHCADSKFYGDKVLSSKDGLMTIIDYSGKVVKQYDNVHTNWLSALDDEGVIVYGNSNCEIGIARLDSDYNLISNEVIKTADHLMIDPTILKVEDTYYITYTDIIGTVNNKDSNVENGEYIINLLSSTDLSNWTEVGEVVRAKNNLEDADIFFEDGHFNFVYEQEDVDCGNSAIMLRQSLDATGTSWGEPITLLENDCDHEPAAIEKLDGDIYRLYYSCDKGTGGSYAEGKVYYAEYDKDFSVISKDTLVPTVTQTGILLYDVKYSDNQVLYLYCKNYFTDNQLFIEEQSFGS